MFGFGNKKVENDIDTPEHAVIIRSVFDSGDEYGTEEERINLQKLEEELDEALSRAGFEHDGHDIGDGEFTIYCYGSDADEMLPVIQQCLRGSAFVWFDIIQRYGVAEDTNAPEKYTKVNSNI